MMIVAEDDWLTPVDLAIEALGRVREPKRLDIIPGGHLGAWVTGFDTFSTPALESLINMERKNSSTRRALSSSLAKFSRMTYSQWVADQGNLGARCERAPVRFVERVVPHTNAHNSSRLPNAALFPLPACSTSPAASLPGSLPRR